ncbi:MAG: histidine phosphatase family protein [Steroidobacteraceae bacterium]
MSVIYLIRHGQASFGTDNYDQLSPLGREQSAILGSYFAAPGEPIHSIYTGSLQRQRETAQLVAAALAPHAPPLSVEPAFDEYESESILHAFAASLTAAQRDEAGWPGLHTDRRRSQFFLERAARAWVEARIVADGMLPWRDFHGRIIAAIEQIMLTEGRGKTLLVSTSGGVIGTIVAHVLGLANHIGIELNWAVHNASITRLIYNADKMSLSMFNSLPHLDQEGRRQLITYR